MSIFKEKIHPEIQSQIDKRQNALIRRTPKDLQYINGRNAWIRMTSNVIVEGQPDLAKKYILQGGTLNDKNTPKFSVGTEFDKAYSLKTPKGVNNNLGIRPMPGITNMEIKTKSAYGSLREATINFVCWDIKQLEDLELLYMRPGYTLILEWGWAPYLGNDDKVKSDIVYFNLDDVQDKSLQGIQKHLYETSTTKYNGNYDAFIGYIKNYNWSFRDDGGYDCTTTIISVGEVIESLKINYGTFNLSPRKPFLFKELSQGTLDNITDVYAISTFGGILYELVDKAIYSEVNQKFNEGVPFVVGPFDDNRYINLFSKTFTTSQNPTDDKFSLPNSNGVEVYITLDDVCYLLNKYILPYAATADGKKPPFVKISTQDREYLGNDPLYCLADPLQVSVNPLKCLIKSPTWTNLQIQNLDKIPNSKDDNYLITIKNNNYLNDGNAKSLLNSILDKRTITQKEINELLLDYFKKYDKNILTKALTSLIFEYEDRFDVQTQLTNIQPTANIGQFQTSPSAVTVSKVYMFNGRTDGNILNMKFIDNNPRFFKDGNIPISIQEFMLNKVEDMGEKLVATDPNGGFFSRFGSGEKIITETYNFSNNISNIFRTLTNNDISTSEKAKRIANEGNLDNKRYANEKLNLKIAKLKTQEDINTTNEALKKGFKFLNNIPKPYFKDNDPSTYIGTIGNIYINIEYMYNILMNNSGIRDNDKKEKNEIDLYTFIKKILKDVQTAIGNVNNFEIYVENNEAKIIDVGYVNPNQGANKNEEIFHIEIQGLRTIARKVSFNSQIFKEQSTTIAISAQNSGGKIGIDNTSMLGYNEGLTDRILLSKGSPLSLNEATNISVYSNLSSIFSRIAQFVGGLKGDNYDNSISLNGMAKYEDALRDLIQYIKQNYNNPNKFKAIIPTKLDLTIDGLGGLIIGNIFKINEDRIPTGYKGDNKIGKNLAFIVIGLGHSLQNNDWITNINAQTVILDLPQEQENGNFDYNQIFLNNGESTVLNVFNNQVSSSSNIPSNNNIDNTLKPVANQLGMEKGVQTLILAQAQREGYYPGSRSFRNNNPGNLADSVLLENQFNAQLEPAVGGGTRRFAQFPTLKDGLNAKYDYIKRIKDGKHKSYPKNPSLSTYMYQYAPPSENNTEGYISYLIAYFKKEGYSINRNTTLQQIFDL